MACDDIMNCVHKDDHLEEDRAIFATVIAMDPNENLVKWEWMRMEICSKGNRINWIFTDRDAIAPEFFKKAKSTGLKPLEAWKVEIFENTTGQRRRG